MQIEHISELELTAPVEREIAGLLARCFDTDFGGRSYYFHRHNLRLVARDPGIVGHMALHIRAIKQGNRRLHIVGLAEVATDPERRGQGIASTLLGEAIEVAKNAPATHFLLFGDAPLYAGHGFRAAKNAISYLSVDADDKISVAHFERHKLMVLELTAEPWDHETPIDLIGPKF